MGQRREVTFWQDQWDKMVARQQDKWILLGLILLFMRRDYEEWAYFALGALVGIITGRSGQRRSSDHEP
jgi:hypothetical protein